MTLRLLVVASETPVERDRRRSRSGASSDETYVETLRALAPGADVETMSCVDDQLHPSQRDLTCFDGAFFAGSPIEMHTSSAESRSAVQFMIEVFEAGLPAFGSCAGLQIAAVAAGGRSAPRSPSMKAGFVRGIVATGAGRDHFLHRGRPLVWDAPAMHANVIAEMPESGSVLAHSKHTPVEAAEIRHLNGVFYGVQYHPEIGLDEIASALRREAPDLIDQGLARDETDVEAYSALLEDLAADPSRSDLAWRLGIDADAIDPTRRTTEISNFLRQIEAGTS